MSRVHIRKRAIAKGRHSIFLDFSPPLKNPRNGKPQRFEFLKLFLYDKPSNTWQRSHNTETKALIENIRATRQLDIQNRRFNFISDRSRDASYLEFYQAYIKSKQRSHNDNFEMAYRYFLEFAGHDIRFTDVNEFFCNDFRNFLLSQPAIGNRGRRISTNTAVSYFAKFRSSLQQAYKKGLLSTDLFRVVDPINPKETHREQLELEEFQLLVNTPAKSRLIKSAAIFSGLTGLRFSDIKNLTWSNVRGSEGKFHLLFTQEKTEGAEILPISDQAVEILGDRGSPDDRVFSGLSYSAMRSCFADWIPKAGISKNITFHSFRHTFATLQLELGTELFTVSKMLGHKSIKTTLIYTKVKDKQKIEAASRIKLKFDSSSSS